MELEWKQTATKSYLSRLHDELVSSLAMYLPWRDLYEQYTHLPEYRRYDNPNHPLWRTLYHRDLSSYPLPDNYRDKFFSGCALLEEDPGEWALVKMGYDRPLEAIWQKLDTDSLHLFANAAAKRGYLSIVRMMRASPNHDLFLLEHAAEGGHWEIFDYVRSNLTFEPDYAWLLTAAASGGNMRLITEITSYVDASRYEHGRALSKAAGKSGSPQVIEYVQNFLAADFDYTKALTGAIEGGHLDLMEVLHSQGGRVDLPDIMESTHDPSCMTVEVYRWIFDHEPHPPPDTAHRLFCGNIAYTNDVEAAKYVLQLIPENHDPNLLYCAAMGGSPAIVDLLLQLPGTVVPFSLLHDAALEIDDIASREVFWRLYDVADSASGSKWVKLFGDLNDGLTFVQLLDKVRLTDKQRSKVLDVLFSGTRQKLLSSVMSKIKVGV